MSKLKFWAIGDLHLSLSKPRDMSRFSDLWINHTERIAAHWRSVVAPEDVVLIVGDISWASSVNRVKADLNWMAQLPGHKIMIRGNHDKWWTSIEKVRALVGSFGMTAIQGDCTEVGGVLICGAQGHIAPHDPYYQPDPPKNRYERELGTLQSALTEAATLRQANQPLVVLMHYPPFTSDGQPTAYAAMIEAHAPALCLYGHLHKPQEWTVAIQGQHRGIDYRLLAADYVDMQLQAIQPYSLTDDATE